MPQSGKSCYEWNNSLVVCRKNVSLRPLSFSYQKNDTMYSIALIYCLKAAECVSKFGIMRNKRWAGFASIPHLVWQWTRHIFAVQDTIYVMQVDILYFCTNSTYLISVYTWCTYLTCFHVITWAVPRKRSLRILVGVIY